MKKLTELMMPAKKAESETAAEKLADRLHSNSIGMLQEVQKTDWIARLFSSGGAQKRQAEIQEVLSRKAFENQQLITELGKELVTLRIDAERNLCEANLLIDHHDQVASIKKAADNEFIQQAVRSLAEKKFQIDAIRAMNVDPELARQVEQHTIAAFHENVNKHLGQTIG